MDKHGNVSNQSPLKGVTRTVRRSTAQKAEQLRSKNQSVLTPATEDMDMGGTLYKTLENRSQRRVKKDKIGGVDQIWTTDSIVENAMAKQAQYRSEERPGYSPQVQPTFIKQLIEN